MANLATTIQTTFSTLSARERRMVAIGGVVLAVVVVFFVLFGFGQKAASIRRTLKLKSEKIEEVLTLAAGYREARAKQEGVERQLMNNRVGLISFLEEKAKAASLELPSISPRPDVTLEGTKIVESSVEVVLTDIKLNRLVDFLTSVEAGPGIVKVKHLRVEPHVAAEHLTAWITIATYKTKG